MPHSVRQLFHALVRTTGGLGIPSWHVGVHPMGIFPALIRLPMFLMVTAVVHSVLIVGFRLETNCFSRWFTCSTGLVEPSLDPVFIEVVLLGSPNKVMRRLFLYVMMLVMELPYTLVELLDGLTGNVLVSMLLAGFSMLLLLSLFVGGKEYFVSHCHRVG